jgi:hypothetical protein
LLSANVQLAGVQITSVQITSVQLIYGASGVSCAAEA